MKQSIEFLTPKRVSKINFKGDSVMITTYKSRERIFQGVKCPLSVLSNVIAIWNATMNSSWYSSTLVDIDTYLLDEGNCSQEDREEITETLFDYAFEQHKYEYEIEDTDFWRGFESKGQKFDLHYCEEYNQVCVYPVIEDKTDVAVAVVVQEIHPFFSSDVQDCISLEKDDVEMADREDDLFNVYSMFELGKGYKLFALGQKSREVREFSLLGSLIDIATNHRDEILNYTLGKVEEYHEVGLGDIFLHGKYIKEIN